MPDPVFALAARPPKAPGWYWAYGENFAAPRPVVASKTGLIFHAGADGMVSAVNFGRYRWSGRIPEPASD